MTKEDVKRKLTAILSADVKEYSRLMREDELATVQTLKIYRELMTTLIRQHHGRVVDSPGDNILAEFASVVDAVQGAVAIQKELKVKNDELQDHRKMEFRIGINLGDVIVEDDRIYGDGINIAARLEGMADAGGVCISRTAFDQIEDKLPFGYEYMGEKLVKNITKPVRAYKVLLWPEETVPENEKEKHTWRTIRKKAHAKRTKGERLHVRDIEKPPGKLIRDEAKSKAKVKKRLHKHLITYLGVICFLLIINILTYHDSRQIWFHWPAICWGLFLYLFWVRRKIERTENYNKPKKRFYKHTATYLGVICFLLVINILTYHDSRQIWFHWPALGWGLFLFFHWQKSSTS